MTSTILEQLEYITGVDPVEEPFIFALVLIFFMYVIKNIFSMLYSFFKS